MTRNTWHETTSRFALAAVFAAGVAALPVAFSGDSFVANAAVAQTSDGGGDGSAADDAVGGDDDAAAAADAAEGADDDTVDVGASGDGDGVAAERATAAADGVPDETADNVYEILGTTRTEAESADTHTSASAQSGPLEGYQTEVERGNLDAAAENLATIAGEPITQEMVSEVNTELGVETTLSAAQIANAAAQKQDSAN